MCASSAACGEPEWRTVFYFSLIATLISGAIMLFDTIHPVTLHSLLLLLGLGSSATLAQLALTRAYSTGKTLVASSLSYSAVVFATPVWHIAVGRDSVAEQLARHGAHYRQRCRQPEAGAATLNIKYNHIDTITFLRSLHDPGGYATLAATELMPAPQCTAV